MKLYAAAIQMCSAPLEVQENLQRADDLIRRAADQGAELVVLPEMFNTGYGLFPDFSVAAEDRDGPTIRHMLARAREWGIFIAAGFVEREGHHLYDSLAFCTPDSEVHIYRKRNLVFWERFRFCPGRSPLVVKTRLGRIGFAICADMIYRKVWSEYRDQIDLAVVGAAWPEFADRHTGRKHWLFGKVGPMSGEIPLKVAEDLGIPVVFANQCGETHTTIPILRTRIVDRFSGKSSLCDGKHGMLARAGTDETVLMGELTLHSPRGLKTWHSTSPSVSVDSYSRLEHSSLASLAPGSTGERAVAASHSA